MTLIRANPSSESAFWGDSLEEGLMEKKFKAMSCRFWKQATNMYWKLKLILVFLKSLAQAFSAKCIYEIPWISTRWVRFLYCRRTKPWRTNLSRAETILPEPGFKPGAAGWEARMLPLSYTSPLDLLHYKRGEKLHLGPFPVGPNVVAPTCIDRNKGVFVDDNFRSKNCWLGWILFHKRTIATGWFLFGLNFH